MGSMDIAAHDNLVGGRNIQNAMGTNQLLSQLAPSPKLPKNMKRDFPQSVHQVAKDAAWLPAQLFR
jgi:hypothetical protein